MKENIDYIKAALYGGKLSHLSKSIKDKIMNKAMTSDLFLHPQSLKVSSDWLDSVLDELKIKREANDSVDYSIKVLDSSRPHSQKEYYEELEEVLLNGSDNIEVLPSFKLITIYLSNFKVIVKILDQQQWERSIMALSGNKIPNYDNAVRYIKSLTTFSPRQVSVIINLIYGDKYTSKMRSRIKKYGTSLITKKKDILKGNKMSRIIRKFVEAKLNEESIMKLLKDFFNNNKSEIQKNYIKQTEFLYKNFLKRKNADLEEYLYDVDAFDQIYDPFSTVKGWDNIEEVLADNESDKTVDFAFDTWISSIRGKGYDDFVEILKKVKKEGF